MEVTPRQSNIDPQGGGTWEGSALLSHLNSATQYEAKVLPQNFFGFTQPKTVFNFATKGAGIIKTFQTLHSLLILINSYHNISSSLSPTINLNWQQSAIYNILSGGY